MLGLAQRIGLPRLIQVIIECWNEVFLLLLLVVMFIGIRRDSKNELRKSVKIPFTWELIVFYGATFLYDLCDVLDVVFGGGATHLSYIVIRCGVFMYYAVGGFMTLFYLQVVKKHIAEKLGMQRLKALLSGLQFMQIPLFMILAVTPFKGVLYRITENNEYERSFGYNIWQMVTILTFVLIAGIVIAQWRRIDRFMKEVIIVSTIFPIVGLILGMFIPLSFNNIMVSLAGLLLFLIYEKNKNMIINKRTQELEIAKAELAESRLTMMLSQIKPHFIFNSMNAIMELCYTEPELAAPKTPSAPSAIKVVTFGSFVVYNKNGEVLKFSSRHAQAIFAYLIDQCGYPVAPKDIAADVFEIYDYDSYASKRVSRYISELRNDLAGAGFDDVVIKESRTVKLNKQRVSCALYDALQGDEKALAAFRGEYMIDYSWAENSESLRDLKEMPR